MHHAPGHENGATGSLGTSVFLPRALNGRYRPRAPGLDSLEIPRFQRGIAVGLALLAAALCAAAAAPIEIEMAAVVTAERSGQMWLATAQPAGGRVLKGVVALRMSGDAPEIAVGPADSCANRASEPAPASSGMCIRVRGPMTPAIATARDVPVHVRSRVRLWALLF